MLLRLHTVGPTFELFAISQHKSDIIFIPVFCLFQNFQEVLELRCGREVVVVVDVDDGELRVHLMVVLELTFGVDLFVGQGGDE